MMRPWKHHGSGRYFGRFVSLGFFPAILFLALLHVWGSWRLKFQPDNFQFSHTHYQNLDKKYMYAPFCENKNHQRPQSGLTAKVAILVGHPKSKFGPFYLFIYLMIASLAQECNTIEWEWRIDPMPPPVLWYAYAAVELSVRWQSFGMFVRI